MIGLPLLLPALICDSAWDRAAAEPACERFAAGEVAGRAPRSMIS